MRREVTLNKTPAILDPNNKFSATPQQIVDACGLVLPWVLMADPEAPLRPQLEAAYGFGPLHEFSGMTIEPDFSLTYPEDPDLHPIIEVPLPHETFRMYTYAIVMISSLDPGTGQFSHFISRMD
jgi:hypothetical protein